MPAPRTPGLPLRLAGVARRFGRRWAVAGVTLEIGAGESWMIVGANGSGKTTLLRCLSTSLRPHAGAIAVDGMDLWTHREALRPRIAYLSHALQVWDDLSPLDNLRAWSRLGGGAADPEALLRRVDLDPRRRDPVRALSAGMKRRLALARMLLKEPALALLDEPFTALDPDGRAMLVGVIDELRAKGTTVVIVSHLPEFAQRCCTRALAMASGRVAWIGAPADAPREVLR